MSDSDTTKRLDTAGGPPDRPDEILSTGSPSTHGSVLAMSRQEPFQTTMDPLQVHTIPTSSSASLPMGAASQTMPGACQGSRRIHRTRTTGARRHRLLRLLVNRHLGLTSNNSRRMGGYHLTGKRGGHRYHQRLCRCRARRCLRPRLGRSMHHNLLRHRCHTRHRCGVRRRRNRSM